MATEKTSDTLWEALGLVAEHGFKKGGVLKHEHRTNFRLLCKHACTLHDLTVRSLHATVPLIEGTKRGGRRGVFESTPFENMQYNLDSGKTFQALNFLQGFTRVRKLCVTFDLSEFEYPPMARHSFRQKIGEQFLPPFYGSVRYPYSHRFPYWFLDWLMHLCMCLETLELRMNRDDQVLSTAQTWGGWTSGHPGNFSRMEAKYQSIWHVRGGVAFTLDDWGRVYDDGCGEVEFAVFEAFLSKVTREFPNLKTFVLPPVKLGQQWKYSRAEGEWVWVEDHAWCSEVHRLLGLCALCSVKVTCPLIMDLNQRDFLVASFTELCYRKRISLLDGDEVEDASFLHHVLASFRPSRGRRTYGCYMIH